MASNTKNERSFLEVLQDTLSGKENVTVNVIEVTDEARKQQIKQLIADKEAAINYHINSSKYLLEKI